MTARKTKSAPVEVESTFGPSEGGNAILRAWRGLYHLFGARVQQFNVDEFGGVTVVGLTVDPQYGTPQEVVSLLPQKAHRIDLVPTIFWVMGEAPAHFSSSLEITKWLTSFMKEPGKKGRSPQIAKTAIQNYKNLNGLAVPRGRPRKTFKVTEIGALDPQALDGVDVAELTKLRETLDSVLAQEVTA